MLTNDLSRIIDKVSTDGYSIVKMCLHGKDRLIFLEGDCSKYYVYSLKEDKITLLQIITTTHVIQGFIELSSTVLGV